MDSHVLTERVRASELRDDWRRKLGLENDPNTEVEVTLRTLAEGARGTPVKRGLVGARQRLGLDRIDPMARDAELRAERDAWDNQLSGNDRKLAEAADTSGAVRAIFLQNLEL